VIKGRVNRFEGVRTARPHRANHVCRALAWLCSAVITAACSDAQAALDVAIPWSADTLYADPVLLLDLADTTRRANIIDRAFHIRATPGHMFVSDVGSDRIAVLDSAASVVRWIGRRGSGPGEFRGVSHLAIDGDRLFVAEALNGRVSELTLTGGFVRSYNAPFAAGALTASVHTTLIATRADGDYAGVLHGDGAPRLALPRVDRSDKSRNASRDARWHALPGHDLIVADSNGAWVFDQATGDVCRYDVDETLERCSPLPLSLLERLNAYRTERVTALERGTGLRVSAAPLAKDMVRAGVWLAILLPLPEMPIALFSTNDGSLTPVLIDPESLPDWARGATSFACDGRSFILAGEEGLGRLYLKPSRISR
jgi:hypothetical protein